MTDTPQNRVVRFPFRTLTAALVLTGLLLAGLVWSTYGIHQGIERAHPRDLRIEELRGTIIQLREVQTLLARMAVATGDLSWEKAYHNYDKQMDIAVKEAIQLTSQSGSAEAAALAETAENKLEEMENRAFKLVRDHRPDEARTALSSAAYADRKKAHANSTAKFMAVLREHQSLTRQREHRAAIALIVAMAASILMLLATWLTVIRRLNQWRALQAATIAQITKAKAELRRAHGELEKRVATRTAELSEVNARLQRDIIERQGAEEKLRRSEALLAEAQEIAHIGSWNWDLLTDAIVWSEEHYRIAGTRPDGIPLNLERAIAFIHPDDRANTLDLMKRASENHQPYESIIRIPREDGSISVAQSRARTEYDAAGRPVRVFGTLQDITERTRTEQALIAKELEARLMHRATTMASETQSFEAAMQQCLALVCEATGWTLGHAYVMSEDGSNRLIPTAIWYETGGQARTAFREVTERTVLHAGASLPGRVLATGEPVWMVDVQQDPTFPRAATFRENGLHGAFAFPIKVAGRCVAVLEFFREERAAEDHDLLQIIRGVADQLGRVLERKRAEQALRLSEERFRLLSKATNDAIWDWDLVTNRLDWSESFETLFGFARSEVEPTLESWTNRIHPDDSARVSTSVHAAIDGGAASYSDEYRFRCKDGHYAYVLDRGHIIRDAAGKVVRMVGAMTDLSDRKKAESLREELNRQLRDVSRRAGMAEVATDVLHNVGNVLNSVNVSATVAMDKLRASRVGNLARAAAMLSEHAADLGDFLATTEKGKQLPTYLIKLATHVGEEQAEVLNELTTLGSNVEHIKNIVSMQQSYARVAGVTEVIAAASLVEDALGFNLGAFERHHVQISREYDELPPLTTDKHKSLQILVNLINNAKHAVEGNAESDRHVILRIGACVDRADRVRIQVIDNGMGITAENLTRMFSHGFTTRKDGHGFGLHSAALAAKELGGSLAAHSDGPGTGATFTLELPLVLTAVSV